MDQCFFLGFWELPGGNCADWYSGTASTSAVIVALLGYFLTERRLAREAQLARLATLASIGALLKSVVTECEANARMFKESMQEIDLFEKKFFVTQPLASIKTPLFSHLDKSQTHLLLQTSRPELADRIVLLLQSVNTMLVGTEDHVVIRSKLSALIDETRYSFSELKEDSDLAKRILAQLYIVGRNSDFMSTKTEQIHLFSRLIAEEFNDLISTDFRKLRNFGVSLEELENPKEES